MWLRHSITAAKSALHCHACYQNHLNFLANFLKVHPIEISQELQKKHNLWLDLWKRVFHTHPISWTCRTITLLSNDVWYWNFLQPLTFVGVSCLPNFKSIAFTNLKLEIVKVNKLDVCWRPLFANPVTFYIPIEQH